MPVRIRVEHMPQQAGTGWQEIILADSDRVGIPGIRLSHWKLDPGTAGPEQCHRDAEGFLYVSRGGGMIWVNGSEWPLAPETVIWLEPGDCYQIRSGKEGIEILYVAVQTSSLDA
ncbi:cupin domain-containing protein [Thermoflexus sp.]|uniref:cupin domain-containing protein n=1 Tax=Thermoflexus sp. TaxID=1969742 RepID=UPI00299860DE|nr:cupin domain-containing protein [Thermoflexus sp.]MDW8065207.1 cupin domain-containing protein [Anaerolineae bacterium]